MTNELFVKIVLLIFSLILTLAEIYVLPLIRAKMNGAQIEQLNWYITCAVRCAEQIYTPDEWKEKKAYVMDKALQFVNGSLHLSLTPEDVDTIVEGIVNTVKKG